MEPLISQVPKSYQIYIDQFDSDPDGTIEKLEQHIEKRNIGAVGYYFLAILCRKAGHISKATKYAISAKIHAPGSPVFDKLPYYMQHPDAFEAWIPDSKKSPVKKEVHKTSRSHPIQDLDDLISKLSGVESKRIRITEAAPDDDNKKDLSERSSNVDDIFTETLALIHEKQGNYEDAITVYKQLRKTAPSKREHFDDQIFRLRRLADENNAE